MKGEVELCLMTLDLFVSFYGAEAGNLALKAMATGGLFIGGGIAPKILPKLREPGFLKAFTDKGRVSAVLEAIPVSVILNDKTALMGAARVAALSRGR
jgi:glucokinase